jgi:hypothetical protein
MSTRFIGIGLAACTAAAALTGCPGDGKTPPPPPPDSTAPQFLNVEVRLETPTTPPGTAGVDITNTDANRGNLAENVAIRVIATAGDAESRVRSMTINSDIRWQCKLGAHSEIIGVLTNAPLTFDPITAPASPVNPLQINVAAHPTQTPACDRSPGHGPVNMAGFVRVTATNGAGLATTSRSFTFDYQDLAAADGVVELVAQPAPAGPGV